MTSVVVDTDVLSFLFKNHPISALYEADLAGSILLISFMTVAELDRWAIQSRWGSAPGVAAAVPRTLRAAAL
jgi:tRNA(fMet)-specific endonuclease VapC